MNKQNITAVLALVATCVLPAYGESLWPNRDSVAKQWQDRVTLALKKVTAVLHDTITDIVKVDDAHLTGGDEVYCGQLPNGIMIYATLYRDGSIICYADVDGIRIPVDAEYFDLMKIVHAKGRNTIQFAFAGG